MRVISFFKRIDQIMHSRQQKIVFTTDSPSPSIIRQYTESDPLVKNKDVGAKNENKDELSDSADFNEPEYEDKTSI